MTQQIAVTVIGTVLVGLCGFFYTINNQVIQVTAQVTYLVEQVKELKTNNNATNDRLRQLELGQHGKP